MCAGLHVCLCVGGWGVYLVSVHSMYQVDLCVSVSVIYNALFSQGP